MRNRIVAVIAPKGAGKTHVVCEIIKTLDRVAVFDMAHEFAYLESCDEVFTGRPKDFAKYIEQDRFRVVYRPTVFEHKGEHLYSPEFSPIATLCYLRGRMALVIDEAHELCAAATCPRIVLTASKVGRHRQLDMYFISQRFVGLAPWLRINIDELIFFQTTDGGELDEITDRCGPDCSDAVRNLRPLQQGPPLKPGGMIHWTKYDGWKVIR